ncbi:hypothetical protein [Pseudoalteromonas denitrificans]|uniref:Uncharacterized protein n=1 Tax=Pseudoalteromonas denitrificans DSM 6059 TaxID=1123010 RepID=A0A1I1DRC2_9GAMM|nr:hypothetical protein [Pseudoalteromonas denitrificans]SFB77535.1 hypothetical protein SAMN02745724_00020 [Pseudoalteromonas denitrificans DSM 6059]
MATFTQTEHGTTLDRNPNNIAHKLKLVAGVLVAGFTLSLVFSGLIAMAVIGSIAAGIALLFRK